MKRLPPRPAAPRGFTLIEVMITVAIVAILASVAYPSYRDYIIRSRLVDATNGMVTMRADMERYFQDNRTYATVTGVATTPCARTPASTRTFGTAPNTFLITCSGTPSGTGYLLAATGAGAMANFGFTAGLSATNPDIRSTTTSETGWTAPTGNNTCWVVRRGQTCP